MGPSARLFSARDRRTTLGCGEDRGRETKVKNGQGGFPGGTVVKNPPANAGDTGASPGPGRSHMPRSN